MLLFGSSHFDQVANCFTRCRRKYVVDASLNWRKSFLQCRHKKTVAPAISDLQQCLCCQEFCFKWKTQNFLIKTIVHYNRFGCRASSPKRSEQAGMGTVRNDSEQRDKLCSQTQSNVQRSDLWGSGTSCNRDPIQPTKPISQALYQG